MLNSPQVSIICPLYNKRNFVIETINSVLVQTLSNWELIIVDDGSTDGSYELVEEKMADEKRIKLIRRSQHKSTKGGSVCRNIGIEHANGRFIMFLDADDLMLKECLSERIQYVNKFPNYSWYIFTVRKYKDGKVLKSPKLIDRIELCFSKDDRKYFIKQFLKFDLPWHTSSTFWKSDFLREIHGFNEVFQRLQDPELHLRALLQKDYLFKVSPNKYDFLHRIDENRVDWKPYIHISKKMSSYIGYIEYFVPILSATRYCGLVKYLQGYLIAAELLFSRFEGKLSTDELELANRELIALYSKPGIKTIKTMRYKRFIAHWKKVKGNRFLKIIRYPSIIVMIYKKIFI